MTIIPCSLLPCSFPLRTLYLSSSIFAMYHSRESPGSLRWVGRNKVLNVFPSDLEGMLYFRALNRAPVEGRRRSGSRMNCVQPGHGPQTSFRRQLVAHQLFIALTDLQGECVAVAISKSSHCSVLFAVASGGNVAMTE